MPKSTCALSLPNHYLAAGLGVHLQVRGDCGDGVLDLEEVALHLGRVRVRARARVRIRVRVQVTVRWRREAAIDAQGGLALAAPLERVPG